MAVGPLQVETQTGLGVDQERLGFYLVPDLDPGDLPFGVPPVVGLGILRSEGFGLATLPVVALAGCHGDVDVGGGRNGKATAYDPAAQDDLLEVVGVTTFQGRQQGFVRFRVRLAEFYVLQAFEKFPM